MSQTVEFELQLPKICSRSSNDTGTASPGNGCCSQYGIFPISKVVPHEQSRVHADEECCTGDHVRITRVSTSISGVEDGDLRFTCFAYRRQELACKNAVPSLDLSKYVPKSRYRNAVYELWPETLGETPCRQRCGDTIFSHSMSLDSETRCQDVIGTTKAVQWTPTPGESTLPLFVFCAVGDGGDKFDGLVPARGMVDVLTHIDEESSNGRGRPVGGACADALELFVVVERVGVHQCESKPQISIVMKVTFSESK